jgi:hypothetical protein
MKVLEQFSNFLRATVEPYVDFDAIDRFSEISSELFRELVLKRLGKATFARKSDDEPYPFLSLKPIVGTFPIMVERPSANGKYWDDPVGRLDSKSVVLLFIGFYDWDKFGYIDLQYYRAKITGCEEHPEIVGREGLVDVHHARVILDE